MKNRIFKLFILCTLVLLSSCEKDDNIISVNGAQSNPILLALENGVNLNENYPSNPALTLTWEYANYGQAVVPNYEVQFSTDEAFTNPYTAVITNLRNYTWSSQSLNAIAQDELGMNANEEGTMYIRVISSLGTNNTYAATSNVLMVSLTPYASYNFKDWYLVGDATAPGWSNNNNNPPLFRDPSNPDLYSYTGYFGAGSFKLIQVPGQWAPMYGTNDGGATMTFRPTESDPDPGTWPVSAPGYYTYTFNFGSLEATVTPYDASSATIYTSMGLIGSATANGWDGDTPMSQSSFDVHQWYVLNVELAGGEAKFRANGTWDSNWGSDTVYSGTGTGGGPNIPVISGTYNVWFNDLSGQYMFIPVM